MHELSIAQAIVKQLEQVSAEHDGAHVTQVHLRVGTLSGVDPEALRTVFPLAADGTVAAQAELDIKDIDARIRCKACSRESSPCFPFLACELCGSTDTENLQGHELLIQSVELG